MIAQLDDVETVRAEDLVPGDCLYVGPRTPDLQLLRVDTTRRGAIKVVGVAAALFLGPAQLVKRRLQAS